MSWAPEKKMYLVVMSSIIQILCAFLNCIVAYLYSLRLPLVRVRYRFSRVSQHLEACQEPLLVRASLHRGSLAALVGSGCYRPTSFRLVRSRNTPYSERSALIPFVTSRLDNWPHGNNTSLSCTLCPHSRDSRENFPRGHPSQYCSKASTLNLRVFMSWAPEKKMHLVVMSSTNQILYALLNCIVHPYTVSEFLNCIVHPYTVSNTSCSGAVSVHPRVPPPRGLPGAAHFPCFTAPTITP